MTVAGTFESFGASCQDKLSDRYRGYSGQDGMISSLAANDAKRTFFISIDVVVKLGFSELKQYGCH